MNDQAVAALLSEHQPRKPSKPAKAKKKAPKTRAPRRESTKTITTRLYRKWAEIVKAKSGRKCAICGEPDSKEHPLNAHHIMPRQNFSALRFDPINGIALCPKCHKFGKFSAHKGGIWFADWLYKNEKPRYVYLINEIDKEDLDCRDRETLYRHEAWLHMEYAEIVSIGVLPTYHVKAVVAGEERICKVAADNPKAAEWLAQWSVSPNHRIKVVKTELVK